MELLWYELLISSCCMLGQRRGEELKHGLDPFCGTESEDMMGFCFEINVSFFNANKQA